MINWSNETGRKRHQLVAVSYDH